MKKILLIGLSGIIYCSACKSSKVNAYPETTNYDDTSTRVRAAEKKMKKPVFDTSIQYVPAQK
jgi:hypothetical protein